MSYRIWPRLSVPFCSFVAILLAKFDATASTVIVVSVPDQKLALVCDGERVAEYKISTSRFGLGDRPCSYSTPLGKLAIAERIGAGLPAGAVLKCRRATGEILAVNAQGRDPIVTRILHLRGMEACNENAHSRGIYIHGTPVERTLGKPDSWGCIRMRSKDVVALFDASPVGTTVEILNEPLRQMLPAALAATRPMVELPGIAEAPVGKLPGAERVAAASVKVNPQPNRGALASAKNSSVVYGKWGSDKQSTNEHTKISSVVDLPSLGGVENLQAVQRGREASRTGMGLSVLLW